MYVSLQGDDKISIFSVDPDTGKLAPLGDTEVSGGPAPLAIDPERRFLYVGYREALKVSSYRVDSGSGELSPIGTASLEADPCYISRAVSPPTPLQPLRPTGQQDRATSVSIRAKTSSTSPTNRDAA